MRSPFSKPLKRSAKPKGCQCEALFCGRGHYPGCPLFKAPKPIKKSRIKKHARPASETTRIYGPPARRKFVKSLPCYTCQVEGFTDQAHVAPSSEKGTGYKAGYLWIIPLCHSRLAGFPLGAVTGCHTLYDEDRIELYSRFPDFDAAKAARETQNAWENFAAHRGTPDE